MREFFVIVEEVGDLIPRRLIHGVNPARITVRASRNDVRLGRYFGCHVFADASPDHHAALWHRESMLQGRNALQHAFGVRAVWCTATRGIPESMAPRRWRAPPPAYQGGIVGGGPLATSSSM